MSCETKLYNYLRGLQDTFFEAPDFRDLRQELTVLRKELSVKLDQEDRRKLLKLIDNFSALSEDLSLAAFAAGLRLAFGIMAELHLQPIYSFAAAEEKRASDFMSNERTSL